VGSNSTNPDLIQATSAYPWRTEGILSSSETVNLGVPDNPGYSFMLAGVDCYVPSEQHGPWFVKLSEFPSGFGFWGFSSVGFTYDFVYGGSDRFRGSILTPPGGDYVLEFATLDDSTPQLEFLAWGFSIPYGWSPVGMPAQQ
jgi:hypothetical protein